jgi:hypothetical protein
VSGPFTLEVLKKLSTRGAISRFDEVSEDQRNWKPIDSVDGLFEKISLPSRASHQQTDSSGSGNPATFPGSVGPRYFYARNGKSVGPLEASVLRSLASSGVIGPKDLVWAEGDETAHEAAQAPLLAAIFKPEPVAAENLAEPHEHKGYRLSDILTRYIQDIAFLSGLIVGLLQLLMINALFWRNGGKTIFWWNDQGSLGFLFGVYVNISAISTIILSFTFKKLGRSIPILLLAAFPILITLITYSIYLKFHLVSILVSLAILSPIFTLVIAITEVARYRFDINDYRGVSIVFGKICIISYLILGITILTAFFQANDLSSIDLPFITLIVIISVLLVGITPGILSVLSGFMRRVLLAKFTVLASLISLSSFLFPALLFLSGINYTVYTLAVADENVFTQIRDMQSASQFVLKNLIILGGCITLICTSLCEILLSKNLRQA